MKIKLFTVQIKHRTQPGADWISVDMASGIDFSSAQIRMNGLQGTIGLSYFVRIIAVEHEYELVATTEAPANV